LVYKLVFGQVPSFLFSLFSLYLLLAFQSFELIQRSIQQQYPHLQRDAKLEQL
jgi:type II secretory pathway component PulJ